MKKKSVSLVAALILMLVAIPAGTTGVALAQGPGWVINSSWATTIPTINGVFGAGEWADATVVTLVPGLSYAYVKNDSTNLYMAVIVPDLSNDLYGVAFTPGDFIGVFFDNGHDGVLTQGNEDGMSIAPGITGPPNSWDFVDLWWDPANPFPPVPPPFPPVNFDAAGHGSGAWTHDGVLNYYFEASKPLNSGDPQDLSASPGDTIGLAVVYWEATSSTPFPWPLIGYNPMLANTWGDLVLSSGPSPPPSGGGGGGGFCFIATAAYGSYLDSHVQTLRDFRDQYLETNPVGSALVSAYYELSPPVAEFIDDHPALKPMVRAGLMPAVAMSTVAVNTTLAEKIAMVSGLALVSLALGIWLRRRAARKMTY